jgi:hypothetical protein
MTVKLILAEFIVGGGGVINPYGFFVDIDTNTLLGSHFLALHTESYNTKQEILDAVDAAFVAEAQNRGYTSFVATDIISLVTDSLGEAYVSGIKYLMTRDYISSATVSSGVATFNLTDDGTATGAAVFSEVFADSARFFIDDNNNVYAFAGVTVSADKKRLSISVKRLALSLAVLVWNDAPDGTTVKLTVKGK